MTNLVKCHESSHAVEANFDVFQSYKYVNLPKNKLLELKLFERSNRRSLLI